MRDMLLVSGDFGFFLESFSSLIEILSEMETDGGVDSITG